MQPREEYQKDKHDLLLKIIMMQNLVHGGVYYAGFMKLPKASLSIKLISNKLQNAN